MNESLDDKISRLLANSPVGKKKSQPRTNLQGEWHVYYIKQAYLKNVPGDFQKRHIYYPSHIPEVQENEMVVLHRHPMYEPCLEKYKCHEVNHPQMLREELWKDLYEPNSNSALRFY